MRSFVLAGAVFGTMFVAATAAADAPLANRCGTPSVLRTEPLPPAYRVATGQRVIYLNKTGGHFTVGNTTDSATNKVNFNIIQESGIDAFDIGPIPASFETHWKDIRSCLEKHFAPYNVRLTEERPKSGDYVMAMVGGTGSEIGFDPQSGILGITSTDNFCFVWEAGITFNFAINHAPIESPYDELCATIAHEAGHALSLEHEILDADLMSYVPFADSPSKSFVNQASQCGTDNQHLNSCSCPKIGVGTNSEVRLMANVGARPTDGTAPSLTVKSPSDGSTVPPGFKVVASASDASGMADVIVLVDGIEVGADEVGSGGTYTMTGTATVGMHAVTVRARDTAGNATDKVLNLTFAKSALGEDCATNDSCTSNQCAVLDNGDSFCTQTCTPGAPMACPADFSCDADAKVCIPETGGGCCSASTPGSGIAAMLFAIVVGGTLVRRRRVRA